MQSCNCHRGHKSPKKAGQAPYNELDTSAGQIIEHQQRPARQCERLTSTIVTIWRASLSNIAAAQGISSTTKFE